MNCELAVSGVVEWLKEKLHDKTSKMPNPQRGFVVGVSGGIDSAVTSTLCAMTEYPVAVVSLPINQDSAQRSRAQEQCDWLVDRFTNVKKYEVALESPFYAFFVTLPQEARSDLAIANL